MTLRAPLAPPEAGLDAPNLAGARSPRWSRSSLLPWALGAVAIAITYGITRVEGWPPSLYALLVACLFFVGPDRKVIAWPRFLRIGVPLLGVLYLGYRVMPGTWWQIASYEAEHISHFVEWNELMRSIPLNDAAWLWGRRVGPVSSFLQWVYLWSFATMVWLPVLRSFYARDLRKMARYALSGHILQFPLIVPFYFSIRLHEVWFVLEMPDLLERGLSAEMAPIVAQNCFPSMHTSIAFAMMLLALREKGRWFRYLLVAYTGSVIFSTLYMGIHWVLDVVAGLALGWIATKLADRVVVRVFGQERGVEPAAAL